jgi:hypothetical protein
MAAFHHLGYFPFCIGAPLAPLSRSVEMPLEDAMNLFWLVKQARFVLKFNYNAYVSGQESASDFIRVFVNIDDQHTVYGAKELAERVCLQDSITISGSATNEDGQGSIQYAVRLFANAGFTGSATFPRVTSSDASMVIPSSAVRVSAILLITSSGYYSTLSWFNSLSAPTGGQFNQALALSINIKGNIYTLPTGIGYSFYPYSDGATPSAAYEEFRLSFT